METWIGIDIGTTNCKVGVCNGQYELLELYRSEEHTSELQSHLT